MFVALPLTRCKKVGQAVCAFLDGWICINPFVFNGFWPEMVSGMASAIHIGKEIMPIFLKLMMKEE